MSLSDRVDELEAENRKLAEQIETLEGAIEELFEHNYQLGQNILSSAPIHPPTHPLEQSMIFDSVGLPEPAATPTIDPPKKSKSKLKKLRHKYRKMVYLLNRVNQTYSKYHGAVEVGKYLAMFLI